MLTGFLQSSCLFVRLVLCVALLPGLEDGLEAADEGGDPRPRVIELAPEPHLPPPGPNPEGEVPSGPSGSSDGDPASPAADAPRGAGGGLAGVMAPVTVTALRRKQRSFDVADRVQVETGEEIIHRRASRTTVEALAETPGVSVQETSRGQGSPFMRGLTGFHTLMLVDGVRLSHPVVRSGPNQYFNTVDHFLIDRIEVTSGPASVLYGSDAIAGVLHVLSRRPRMDAGDGVHPGVKVRYASADGSLQNRVELEAVMGSVGVIGGYSYKDFGNLDAGRHTGELRNTDYSQRDGDIKLVWQPSRELTMILAYQHTTQRNVPRTHKTVFGKSYRGTLVGSEQRRDFDQNRDLLYLTTEGRFENSWLDEADLTLSWHQQDEDQKKLKGTNEERKGFTVAGFGSSLRLSSQTPAGRLSGGVDYYHSLVESNQTDIDLATGIAVVRPRGQVADESRYEQLGIYLQDEISLVEDLVTLTLGARYEVIHVDADQVDPDPTDAINIESLRETYDALVGSVRLVVRPTPWLHVVAGISQGFRAPNLDDTTSFNDVKSASFDSPSPDVDSEYSLTYDLGFKVQSGDDARAQLFFYAIDFDDKIVRVATGNQVVVGADTLEEFVKENVSDAEIFGIEFDGALKVASHAEWGDLSLFGGVSWNRGNEDNIINGQKVSRPISRAMPIRGILGLRWEGLQRRGWAEVYAIRGVEQDRLSPRDVGDTQRIPPGGTPGYTVFGIRGGARINDHVRASVGVENLSNRDYRIHGSGQNEPGTNVVLSLEARY